MTSFARETIGGKPEESDRQSFSRLCRMLGVTRFGSLQLAGPAALRPLLRRLALDRRLAATKRAKDHPLAPDLLQRDFQSTAADELWPADFTEITTWQGTTYIAVAADTYSRLCGG